MSTFDIHNSKEISEYISVFCQHQPTNQTNKLVNIENKRIFNQSTGENVYL